MTDPDTRVRAPILDRDRVAMQQMIAHPMTSRETRAEYQNDLRWDDALRSALKERDHARWERDIIAKDAGGGYMHRKLTAEIKSLRAKLESAQEGLRNAVEWLGKHQKPLSLNEVKECFENEKRCREALAKLEESK